MQVESAAKELKEWVGEPRVDLLIHAAGVLHEGDNMPETSLSRVNADFFRRNLEVSGRSTCLDHAHFTPTPRLTLPLRR